MGSYTLESQFHVFDLAIKTFKMKKRALVRMTFWCHSIANIICAFFGHTVLIDIDRCNRLVLFF